MGLNDSFINPTSQRADALAIAPYFGGSIGDEIGTNGEISTITVDEILDRLETTVYTETEVWTKANSDMIANFGFDVDLIAYEGGPHLVANGVYQNNETLVNKLIEANRNPRMKEIILRMFDVWYSNGGIINTLSPLPPFNKRLKK